MRMDCDPPREFYRIIDRGMRYREVRQPQGYQLSRGYAPHGAPGGLSPVQPQSPPPHIGIDRNALLDNYRIFKKVAMRSDETVSATNTDRESGWVRTGKETQSAQPSSHNSNAILHGSQADIQRNALHMGIPLNGYGIARKESGVLKVLPSENE